MHPVVTLTPNPALDTYVEVSRILPDVKLRTGPARLDPGGGGVNVSRVLARLGVPTRAVLPLGGVTGDQVKTLAAAEGLTPEAVPIAGMTRSSFVARSEETGELLRFVTPGPALTREEGAALLTAFADALAPGALCVGSGSLPPGSDGAFWAGAARIAAQAEARFILDSSRGVAGALSAGLFLLRLNFSEAEALAGSGLSWPDGAVSWARTLLARGCEAVILTHGAQGALLVEGGEAVAAIPPPVKVRSAVGAGDSFVGGLAAGLARGEELAPSLRLAVAAAAATMQTEGTALCEAAEVDRIRPLVR
ncbi:1-phosphofructokinase family hexose kinase [Parvularcula oceani]|uniref:1-phosphofructokinase family hexose kinase n=1 Tax=Parvularcula oceani TaxID=1247963 RepID=UPI0004E13F7F|nr:hexose kinase [Parvularcula oceani]